MLNIDIGPFQGETQALEVNIFARHHALMAEAGYVPLPVAPGKKHPSRWSHTIDAGWRNRRIAEARERIEQAELAGDDDAEREALEDLAKAESLQPGAPYYTGLKGWADMVRNGGLTYGEMIRACRAPGIRIGVGHTGTFIGLDLDSFDASLIEAARDFLSALPGRHVARRGRKGFCAYFRVIDGTVASAGIRFGNGDGLDIQAAGRMTVTPPTIHPDTGEAYAWTTEATLFDTAIDALPAITQEQVNELVEMLAGLAGGIVATGSQNRAGGHPRAEDGRSGLTDFRADVCAAAMDRLDAWVPLLPLPNLRKTRAGYEAVPSFRSSGTGQPVHKRKRNLRIDRQIHDFGTGKSYSAISLVRAVLGLDGHAATNWLVDVIGFEVPTWAPKPKAVAAPIEEVVEDVDSAVDSAIDDSDDFDLADYYFDDDDIAGLLADGRIIERPAVERLPVAKAREKTAEVVARRIPIDEAEAVYREQINAALVRRDEEVAALERKVVEITLRAEESGRAQGKQQTDFAMLFEVLGVCSRITAWKSAARYASDVKAEIMGGPRSAMAVSVDPGIGKTTVTIRHFIESLRDNPALRMIFAAASHVICEERAEDIRKEAERQGVYCRVEVWHGLTSNDSSGEAMCLRQEEAREVRDAGQNVRTTLCGTYETGIAGNVHFTPLCPHAVAFNPATGEQTRAKGAGDAPMCPYSRNYIRQPTVWVVPHASLATVRTATFENNAPADLLVIDESFIDGTVELRQRSDAFDLDELATPIEPKIWRGLDLVAPHKTLVEHAVDQQKTTWRNIVAAIDAAGNGFADWRNADDILGLTADLLVEHGVDLSAVEHLREYHADQLGLADRKPLVAGAADRRQILAAAKTLDAHQLRIDVLDEVARLLREMPVGMSGRLLVSPKRNANTLQVRVNLFTPVHPSWSDSAAVLILDAYAPPVELLSAAIGAPVEEVSVRAEKTVRTVQIVNAKLHRNKLIKVEGKGKDRVEKPTGRVDELARMSAFIARAVAASNVGNGRTLHVPRAKLGEWLQPPEDVDLRTLGTVVGSNGFSDHGCVVYSASRDSGVRSFEMQTGVMLGQLPELLPYGQPNEHGYYPQPFYSEAWVEEQDSEGNVHRLRYLQHPDSIVERLANVTVMGAAAQVGYRLRPGARADDDPSALAMFSDFAGLTPVDRVIDYSEIQQRATDKGLAMLARHGVFTGAEHTVKAYKDLFASRKGAREWRERDLDSAMDAAYRLGTEFCGDKFCGLEIHEYRVPGSGSTYEFICLGKTIADVPAHIAQVLGQEVEILSRSLEPAPTVYPPLVGEGSNERERNQGARTVIFTGASAVMAEEPGTWQSVAAARSHLHRNPPVCPSGWATASMTLAGRGERPAAIYFDPAAVTDLADLKAQIEKRLGRPVKAIETN